MPLFFLFAFIFSIFLFFKHTDLPSLPTDEFLHPKKETLRVTSLVKYGSCYQSFSAQALGKPYIYQASWFDCKAQRLHVGDYIDAVIVLKPLHASNSLGSFDSLSWARAHRIVARATIKSAQKNLKLVSHDFFLQKLREHLIEITRDHVKDTQVSGIIESLTLGVMHNLSWETLQVFNLSGTRHLLSISGSHIAMIAMFAYGLFFFLMRLMAIIFPRMNAHTLAIFLSIFLVAFYVSLSGEEAPTLRAFFMALIGLLSMMLHRHSGLFYRIAIAAFFVIAIDENVVYSSSIYLSFAAVFLIAYHQYFKPHIVNKYYDGLRLHCLLLLGLMPISLYFFSQYSLIALLANLLAIPWVGIIILPLAILTQWLSYLGFSLAWLWGVLEKLTHLFFIMLQFFSMATLKIPGLFVTGHMNAFLACILFAIVLFAFLPKGAPLRYFCLLAFLPIFFIATEVPSNKARIVFLNVGQGLSVLVKTHRHLLVYDTGPKFVTGGDVGQSIILPFLYYQGWGFIDTLVVSHGDIDHAGGVDTLKANVKIKHLLSSDLHRVKGAALCQRGQHWRWDGVDFDIVFPDDAHLHQANNSSCVLRISIGKTRALLAGDIEASSEKYLVKIAGDELASSILSVPHHGSRTSSSSAFLASVKPQYAIFSYGFLNRFHFPHASVLQRYEADKVHILATESGTISLEISSQGVTLLK